MREKNIYLKIAVNLLVTAVFILLLIFVAPKVLKFFMPFVIGWIIALLANPIVRFMEKRIKIVRKHGSAIIIVVVLSGIVGLLYLIITALARELIQLVQDLPHLYQNFEAQFNLVTTKLQSVIEMMPEGVETFISNFSSNLGLYVEKFINGIELPSMSDAGSLVGQVANGFFNFIIIIMSSYFFIAEKDNISESIKRIMPKGIVDNYNLVTNNFKKAFGGYFKAQFKIMFVITAIITLGFALLKIDYALFLALGIAFLDFLPFFGTGAVLWPWALIDVISGNYFRAVCLMIIYFVCQVVKQVLQPKMVGDSIGMSPLATLIFMYIGFKLGGFIGIIIGIPVGMVLINFYKAGLFDNLMKGIKIIAQKVNEFRKI